MPDDPRFYTNDYAYFSVEYDSWYLRTTQFPEAWDITKGSNNVIVGVPDHFNSWGGQTIADLQTQANGGNVYNYYNRGRFQRLSWSQCA